MPIQERRARRQQRRQNRRSGGGLISSLFQTQQGAPGQQNNSGQQPYNGYGQQEPYPQQQQNGSRGFGNDSYGSRDQQRGQEDFSRQQEYGQQQQYTLNRRQDGDGRSRGQAQTRGYEPNPLFRRQDQQQQQGPLGLLIGLFTPKSQQQGNPNRDPDTPRVRNLNRETGTEGRDQTQHPSLQEQTLSGDSDWRGTRENRAPSGFPGNDATDGRYGEGGNEGYQGEIGGRFEGQRTEEGRWRRDGESDGNGSTHGPPVYEEAVESRHRGR